MTLPERLGLRRIELLRLRPCDLLVDEKSLEVWRKGDKERTMPLPWRLLDLLERYIEDRRPAEITTKAWLAGKEPLLQRRPTPESPLGRPAGRRRLDDLYVRLRELAPDVFARGDVSLHSYRHSVATFVDGQFGRAVTRAVLGHTSRTNATDVYVHVPLERRAQSLQAYEGHLFAVDPVNQRAGQSPADSTPLLVDADQ